MGPLIRAPLWRRYPLMRAPLGRYPLMRAPLWRRYRRIRERTPDA